MRQNSRLIMSLMLTVIFLITAALPAGAIYYENRPPSKPVLLPGRLDVQFESDVTDARMALSVGSVSFGIETLDKSLGKLSVSSATRVFPGVDEKSGLVGIHDMSKFYTLEFPESVDLETARDELLQNPYVRTVDFVYAMPLDIDPNDPSFSSQWGIKKINDTAAFNIETGSDTAKIAIIDSGVLYSHPDLKDNIWVNPGEDLDGDLAVWDSDDSNMIDNDGNFYDDLVGYDFFSGFGGGLTCWTGEDCNTPDNNPIDFNGHGTHCAGIASAVTNNGIGIAGVAGGWGGGIGAHAGAKIICLRAGGSAVDPDFGYESGYIVTTNAATATSYAIDVGACAINMSFGIGSNSSMTAAMNKALDSGVVIAHSAGNESSEIAGYYDTYTSGGEKVVLSVAWTNSADRKDGGSNYGTWIDISAPGTSIYSTYSNHYSAGYYYASGTSMAAPHVAGVAGLIKSRMPSYDRDEIIPLILDNADDMPNETLWIIAKMGSGRINAYKCIDSLPAPKFGLHTVSLGEAPLEVEFADESPFNPTSWDWNFGDGGSSTDQNPTYTFNDYGLYDVSLTVNDDFGTGTDIQKNLVMVTADTISFGTITAKPNDTIDLEVRLDNKYALNQITMPLRIRTSSGGIPSYVYMDTAIIDGTRTAGFDRSRMATNDSFNKRYTFILYSNYYGGSNYLQPDTGLIAKIRVRIEGAGSSEQLIISDTIVSSRTLELGSTYYNYPPVIVNGIINVAACDRGDANLDEAINILDITFLIDWLYNGGVIPPDPVCGDANADGTINILDITYLIAYLYDGGPPPPE